MNGGWDWTPVLAALLVVAVVWCAAGLVRERRLDRAAFTDRQLNKGHTPRKDWP